MQPNTLRVVRRHLVLCFGVSFFISCMVVPSHADEAKTDAYIEEALQITTEVSKRYEFERVGKERVKLERHPKSILRWSNPVSGEVHGNVFVWTHDGRPEVVGSIFQWFSPLTHGSHEFQSLSIDGIKGSHNGDPVWMSAPNGVEFQAADDALPVAESQLVRLRQMRAISRRFEVQKTDRERVSRQLRLLAHPIFRYGSDDSDVLDGALFVFVQGTDPEVFLMVEARKVGETRKWQYALARMNSVLFVAKYQEQEVWRREILPWGDVKNGQGTYTSFGPFEPENQ